MALAVRYFGRWLAGVTALSGAALKREKVRSGMAQVSPARDI
jgi:hypothetical protein